MSKILIIGCTETTKVLVPALIKEKGIAEEICVASKRKEDADEYRNMYKNSPIRIVTAGVDVTNEEKTLLMMRIFGPTLIINLTPSHLNKTVMEIALKIGASYIDTKYYTDPTGTKCLIHEQFECSSQFYAKNLRCVTGCSFNPAAYVCLARTIINQNLLDTIESVDLIRIDSTKSDTGHTFPSVADLTKLHEDGRLIDNGELKTFEALKYKTTRTFPGMGKRTLYAFDNPVIDSFKNELPEIKNVRYFSSLKKQYLTLVNTLNKIGMLSTTPIAINGTKIAPVDYLEAVIPKAENNVSSSRGTLNIGILATGVKAGVTKSVLLYLTCDQTESYSEYGVSAVGLMSAITTLAGVILLIKNKWNNPGVFTPGDYEPGLLITRLKELGIDYKVVDAEPIEIEETEEENEE